MHFMISQPMNGLSEMEILARRNQAIQHLKELGHIVINSYFRDDAPDPDQNAGVYYLGFSLLAMSKCDGVFFCKGWEKGKGCRIEHEVARTYGLQIMYE